MTTTDRTAVDVDALEAARAAATAEARRNQQLWDRSRVEDYAAVVGVELTPGDDMMDAVNELYLAALRATTSGEGQA